MCLFIRRETREKERRERIVLISLLERNRKKEKEKERERWASVLQPSGCLATSGTKHWVEETRWPRRIRILCINSKGESFDLFVSISRLEMQIDASCKSQFIFLLSELSFCTLYFWWLFFFSTYKSPIKSKSIYIPETLGVSNLMWQFLNQFQGCRWISYLATLLQSFLIRNRL